MSRGTYPPGMFYSEQIPVRQQTIRSHPLSPPTSPELGSQDQTFSSASSREKRVHWCPSVVDNENRPSIDRENAPSLSPSPRQAPSSRDQSYSVRYLTPPREQRFHPKPYHESSSPSQTSAMAMSGYQHTVHPSMHTSESRRKAYSRKPTPPHAPDPPQRSRPPPCPRPNRLPSPDLPELNDSEFCACYGQSQYQARDLVYDCECGEILPSAGKMEAQRKFSTS